MLKDKVVIVAGGNGLLGRKICKGFFDEGAMVVIASRHYSMESAIYWHDLDIASEERIDRLIKNVLKKYGRIDVFINCSFPKTKDWIANVEDVSFESVKENLINHLGGYFLCTQKMAKLMKEQKQGSIINFSSIYGMVGPTFSIYDNTKMTCHPAYPMIKGGIIGMTKYFATYYAKYNVRVNCICPGGIFNDQNKKFVKKYEALTPMGRMGEPEDVVGAVLFLADASYVTGQCIIVDGGFTSW